MMARKLRVLCLHGYGMSGDFMRMQIEKSVFGSSPILKELLDFVFLDAPYQDADARDPSETDHEQQASSAVVESSTTPTSHHEHGGRVWWDFHRLADSPAPSRLAGLNRGVAGTIRCLGEQLRNLGPFDGIVGFSQGGLACHYLIGFVYQRFNGDFEAAATAFERTFSPTLNRFLLDEYGGREKNIRTGLLKQIVIEQERQQQDPHASRAVSHAQLLRKERFEHMLLDETREFDMLQVANKLFSSSASSSSSLHAAQEHADKIFPSFYNNVNLQHQAGASKEQDSSRAQEEVDVDDRLEVVHEEHQLEADVEEQAQRQVVGDLQVHEDHEEITFLRQARQRKKTEAQASAMSSTIVEDKIAPSKPKAKPFTLSTPIGSPTSPLSSVRFVVLISSGVPLDGTSRLQARPALSGSNSRLVPPVACLAIAQMDDRVVPPELTLKKTFNTQGRSTSQFLQRRQNVVTNTKQQEDDRDPTSASAVDVRSHRDDQNPTSFATSPYPYFRQVTEILNAQGGHRVPREDHFSPEGLQTLVEFFLAQSEAANVLSNSRLPKAKL
ncbi:unnamed protein product [Amoebophrya sp. A25]|nr:unnamed protein product [Amoebophrya sp. A25]|eukprot:GSA25T00027017001.1